MDLFKYKKLHCHSCKRILDGVIGTKSPLYYCKNIGCAKYALAQIPEEFLENPCITPKMVEEGF